MVFSRLIAASAILTACAGAAHASYNFITIADPNATGYTVAQGINDAGQVVGSYNVGQQGFLLSGGSYSDVGPASSVATGINNAGAIVGYSTSGSGTSYLIAGGSTTPFTVTGNPTFAQGINSGGTIAGYYDDSLGSHGFVGTVGNFTSLDDPAGLAGSTEATGVNAGGTVVGWSYSTATGNPPRVSSGPPAAATRQ